MESGIPKIFFESGYLLSTSYKSAVENQPTIEAFRDKAQRHWLEYGEMWLHKTVELTGRSFQRKEISANIILHPNMPSCSHPFLINIKKHLPEPDPIHFSELVFHELLHFYLDGEFSEIWEKDDSPLLNKYKAEDDHVTAHLHLYAIQKRVFENTGHSNLWDWVVAQAPKAHHPGYAKAVEILEKEGDEAFFNELVRG